MSEEQPNVPILELKLIDTDAVNAAYMPFIRGGALFVATKETFKLGDEVVLKVRLPEEPQPTVVTGKIVWKTPLGAQGGKKAGVGVQLSGDHAIALHKRLDTITAGARASNAETDTM